MLLFSHQTLNQGPPALWKLAIRVGDHSNTTQIRLQAGHFKVCLWNAQSLTKQLSSFQSYILASHFGLVAITETWLNPNILDGEILSNFYYL